MLKPELAPGQTQPGGAFEPFGRQTIAPRFREWPAHRWFGKNAFSRFTPCGFQPPKRGGSLLATGVNRWGHGALNFPKPPEGATLFVANGCSGSWGTDRALCRPLRGLKDKNIWGAAFHPLTRMARRLPPPLGVKTNAMIALAQCPTKPDTLFHRGDPERQDGEVPAGTAEEIGGRRRGRGVRWIGKFVEACRPAWGLMINWLDRFPMMKSLGYCLSPRGLLLALKTSLASSICVSGRTRTRWHTAREKRTLEAAGFMSRPQWQVPFVRSFMQYESAPVVPRSQ